VHPASQDEVERLARNHGFEVEKIHNAAGEQGRSDVRWTCIALRLPDDGPGALPLLRHVTLNDQKSAAYKPGPASRALPGWRRLRRNGSGRGRRVRACSA
jgi:hypothetical protein